MRYVQDASVRAHYARGAEEKLNKKGYWQIKLIPGLWLHKWRPISFTFVVDNFGVKYVWREHTEHLEISTG